LAGITAAEPASDYDRYADWVSNGRAGEMTYLSDHRSALRSDPRLLLSNAKTILCVGKLYNTAEPYSSEMRDHTRAWISRYAWGDDYHQLLRDGLTKVVTRLQGIAPDPFDFRICVDTAPLLERSFARLAGLGWIGRNTCLINQQLGSWLFLGEVLLSLDLALDTPAPERCGTCRRCIDACPTNALIVQESGAAVLDSRLCISYLTIEKRGSFAPEQQERTGVHVFGCDICQEVCPWNHKRIAAGEPGFAPYMFAPPLAEMAAITALEFRQLFRHTPVWRTKYQGFLRNVAAAMGNSGQTVFLEPLQRLAAHEDEVVRAAAVQAIATLCSADCGALRR
jgi:epoxyqueuosine reductase